MALSNNASFSESADENRIGAKNYDLVRFAINVALCSEDRDFAEKLFVELSDHEDVEVRGSGLLGFGHLARRFGVLEDRDAISSAIKSGLEDDYLYLRSQARSLVSDVKEYLDWVI